MTKNNTHVWVILTEDDYRCVNCDIKHNPSRENQECSYLKNTQRQDTSYAQHKYKSPSQFDSIPEIIGLSGSTPTTVAYVITPKSMKEMSDSNSDFSFLPDWPPNSVKFYTTIHGVVTHGDSNTTSLIDSVGRKKTKRSQNLLKLTFLPFVLNRSLFTNIGEYYNICIKPSFTWRIDSFKIMNKLNL